MVLSRCGPLVGAMNAHGGVLLVMGWSGADAMKMQIDLGQQETLFGMHKIVKQNMKSKLDPRARHVSSMQHTACPLDSAQSNLRRFDKYAS